VKKKVWWAGDSVEAIQVSGSKEVFKLSIETSQGEPSI
jgi:hypothetical protein